MPEREHTHAHRTNIRLIYSLRLQVIGLKHKKCLANITKTYKNTDLTYSNYAKSIPKQAIPEVLHIPTLAIHGRGDLAEEKPVVRAARGREPQQQKLRT